MAAWVSPGAPDAFWVLLEGFVVSTMRGSRRMFPQNPWGSLPHCDFRWETLCGQQTLLVTEGGRQDLKDHSLTGEYSCCPSQRTDSRSLQQGWAPAALIPRLGMGFMHILLPAALK